MSLKTEECLISICMILTTCPSHKFIEPLNLKFKMKTRQNKTKKEISRYLGSICIFGKPLLAFLAFGSLPNYVARMAYLQLANTAPPNPYPKA